MQSKWLFAATPKSADSLISRFSQMFSSSWLSALFAGVPYNREKKRMSILSLTLFYAGCHWLKNVRCHGK